MGTPTGKAEASGTPQQRAAGSVAITDTREGYHQLLSTLQDLKRRHPRAVFQIRLDEASLYAVNLRTFLGSVHHRGRYLPRGVSS